MSLIVGQYYRGNPKQKPKQWGSASAVFSNAKELLHKIGITHELSSFIPFWGPSFIDYVSYNSANLYYGSFKHSGISPDSGNVNFNLMLGSSIYVNTTGFTDFLVFTPTSYTRENPGIWRSGTSSSGTSFHIFQGASLRPWVMISGTDNIKPTSGASLVYNKQQVVSVSIKAGESVKYFLCGALEYTGSLAGSVTFDIYHLLRQYYNYDHFKGSYSFFMSFDGKLHDDQVMFLQDNLFYLLQPPTFRTYFDLAEGGWSTINCITICVVSMGIAANILKVMTISATTINTSIAGVQCNVINERTINCTTGSVVGSGIIANISQTTNIQATTVLVDIYGVQAAIANENAIYCTTGHISVESIDADVSKGLTFQTTTGIIITTGIQAEVFNEKIITCITVSIVIDGSCADITHTKFIDCTTYTVLFSGIIFSIITNESTQQVHVLSLLHKNELNIINGQIVTLITE